MSDIYKCTVTSDRLLSVLAGFNVELPWRFQPSVVLQVPFEEYAQLVKHIVNTNIDLLYFPVNVYADAIRKETTLIKLFYYDLARAIAYEAIFAESKGFKATSIFPSFDIVKSPLDITLTDIADVVESMSQEAANTAFRKCTQYLSCPVNSDMCNHNSQLLNTGLVLMDNVFKKEPIIYNIFRRI